jgi:apolipoprotein N-acyltransferase
MRFFDKKIVLAALAGAVCVFGFAPFGIFPIPVFALAVLLILWLRADSPRHAAWLGFAFGMGLFCAGVGWIYVALHDYGNMHPVLAVLATAAFAAVNAALPAAAGYAQAKFRTSPNMRLLLVMPATWVLFEWLRGLLFTGFPWLAMGYSQVPHSPLAAYAPLFGVFGVSLTVALSAGALLVASRNMRAALSVLAVLWAGGIALHFVEWTQPQGEPISVALVQGNISQELKFNNDELVGTLETYRRLALQQEARLTVLPETAFPLLRSEVPPLLIEQLRNHARKSGGDMVVGAFVRSNDGYHNSVFTLGTAKEQHYHKDHLVPFGEFIPLRLVLGWLINEVLHIPMGDLARGGQTQAPLDIAGQKFAVNICYEDAFGEEIIRALPTATLLVNVTNDAWYGESHAAAQHNQLSQMRALESGRMMLRATNTGVTSIIDVNGKVLKQLPQHQEGVLLGMAQGYQGSTPYVRWGNVAVLLLLISMLAYVWLRRNSSLDKGRLGGV